MRRSAPSVFLAALALAGCTRPDPTEAEAETGGDLCEMEFAQIQAEILVPNCTNEFCHDGGSPAANLDYTRPANDVIASLVDVPSVVCADWIRVVPGDPEASILLAKLHDPPPCGERMPIDAEPLSDHDKACIANWIEHVESTCETCGSDGCVDLDSDVENCGECGNECPTGISCVGGGCLCPLGAQICDNLCVNVATNPDHCGDCGVDCDDDQVCNFGTCVDVCDPGLESCNNACVDTQTSNTNCGECGNVCGEGLSCMAGNCECNNAESISFEDEIAPLLDDNCALSGCHAPPQLQLGLDLREANAYASLVQVASSQCVVTPRVDPGNPGNSYLLDKLRGVELCSGEQMPRNDDPLSLEQIRLVSDWICQGALEN